MNECYCYYEGDYESPKVYRETKRTALRSHTCSECHNRIENKQQYVEVCGLWDEHWSRYKRCTICNAISEQYFPCGYRLGFLRDDMYEHFGVDICGKWPIDEKVR